MQKGAGDGGEHDDLIFACSCLGLLKGARQACNAVYRCRAIDLLKEEWMLSSASTGTRQSNFSFCNIYYGWIAGGVLLGRKISMKGFMQFVSS